MKNTHSLVWCKSKGYLSQYRLNKSITLTKNLSLPIYCCLTTPHKNTCKNSKQMDRFHNVVDKHPFFQIGAGLYAVGRPVQKRNEEDDQIGTNQSLPLDRGALFNRFFGKPDHGPPHVAGGASGPIGGCRDESRTDNPDLDLRHVFDRNNRKTDLI